MKMEESNQRKFSVDLYIANFAASGTLHVDEEVITVEKLRKLMEWGGKWIGLGDGRPQGFGRFAVSSWIVDGKEYGAGVTGASAA